MALRLLGFREGTTWVHKTRCKCRQNESYPKCRYIKHKLARNNEQTSNNCMVLRSTAQHIFKKKRKKSLLASPCDMTADDLAFRVFQYSVVLPNFSTESGSFFSAPLTRAICVHRALKVRCGVVAAAIRCLVIHIMLQDCWCCFCATFFHGQTTRAPSHMLNGGKPASVSTPRSNSNASFGRRARRGACCGSSWSAPISAPWRRGVGGRCCWRALRRHQDLP
jgi:hypothetical protein